MKKAVLTLGLFLMFNANVSAQPFVGKEFRLTESSANVKATLAFDAQEHRVYGFSGVNRYFGSYQWEKNELRLGPLASTMMAGPLEAMEFEADYLKKLHSVTSYQLQGDRLILKTPEGDLVFQLEAPKS